MTVIVLFMPLISSLIAGFFGRVIGRKGAAMLTTWAMFANALVVIILYYEVCIGGSPITLVMCNWINLGWFDVDISFSFDSLTVSMLVPVVFISSLVHLFSIGYMSGDPHLQRFFAYLSFFTFAMILLVTADSLLLLFAGWEAVGLSSYLLVSFWFTRIQANLAGLKAFIMNRFGDWALTLAILVVLATIADLSLPTLFSLGTYLQDSLIIGLVILILIGAIAKSAQIGLHTWLPAAMEGPTPVSALIHAATMVTAGVYLLLRFSPILELTETGLMIVVWVGAITALYGASSGIVEYDLKKVIAYSTTSQLGYMVVAAGLSQYSVSLFHLMNHAFFKALLFLSAGAIIHAVSDEQDFRRMGALVLLLPRTYAMILIGSLSLMALPFFTGFYSKDLILEVALATGSVTSQIAYIMTLLAALFTSFYSVRLMILTFLHPPMIARVKIDYVADPEAVMWVPLFILSIASVFFASITYELILGLGSTVYANSLFVHPDHLVLIDAEFLPTWLKLIPALPLLLLLTTGVRLFRANTMLILSLFVVDWTSLYYSVTDIASLAIMLYLAYSVPFVLVSLVLLIVLIGVLILLT